MNYECVESVRETLAVKIPDSQSSQEKCNSI